MGCVQNFLPNCHTPRNVCVLAEKLTSVRGYLVKHIMVDELFLSYMMEKMVISRTQKSEIQQVCIHY